MLTAARQCAHTERIHSWTSEENSSNTAWRLTNHENIDLLKHNDHRRLWNCVGSRRIWDGVQGMLHLRIIFFTARPFLDMKIQKMLLCFYWRRIFCSNRLYNTFKGECLNLKELIITCINVQSISFGQIALMNI